MNNIIRRTWRQGSLVNIEDLRGVTFQQEVGGHTFEISGVDNKGNTIQLSGTPSGTLLTPANQDVVLTCSVSDGKVYATLPANAYSVPGRFGLTVFITSDGQTTAIYAAVGTISRTQSGIVAPPAGDTVADLINAIEAAIADIPATDTAIKAAMAPIYSTSGLYAVGSYAWYNGVLKRCIVPITTAESYTAAHWTDAALGNDLRDLKSAINNTNDIISNGRYTISAFKQGTVTNPGYNKRCTTNYIRLYPGDQIILDFDDSTVDAAIGSTEGLDSGWLSSDYTLNVAVEADYQVTLSKKGAHSSTLYVNEISGIQITIVDNSSRIFKNEKTIEKVNAQMKPSGHLFKMDQDLWVYNGIVVKNNYDGTFTANGTATGSTYLNFFEFVLASAKTITFKTEAVSGTGPANGVRTYGYNSSDTQLFNHGYGTYTKELATGDYLRFRLAESGETLTNFVFAIYISEGDSVIELPYLVNVDPYAVAYNKTQTLTDTQKATARNNIGFNNAVFDRSLQKVSGNLFGTDLGTITLNNGNITITNNFDGTYTVNGTATGSIYIPFLLGETYWIADETCMYSCLVKTISGTTTGEIRYFVYEDSTGATRIINRGAVESHDKLTSGNTIKFRLAQSGDTFTNFRFGIYFAKGNEVVDMPYTLKNDSGKYNTYATRYTEQEDALLNKVTEDRDENTITVTIITDTHFRYQGANIYCNNDLQGMISQIISKNLNADFIVHMGDVIQGYEETKAKNHNSLAKYWEKQSYGSVPVMYCIAHHEMFGAGEEAAYMNDPTANTPSNCIGVCSFSNMWKDATFSSDRTNWYLDYENIRFIGLNSVENTVYGFRTYDVAFLHNALQNTDKKIIVFAHVPVIYQKTVVNKDDVISELNAYVTSGGEVIAYIHGHTHIDNIIEASSDVKFPLVSVCCALPSKATIPEQSYYSGATVPDRTLGTYSEYCFDVANIHMDTGVIKFFRFGAGSDRTLS